MSTLQDIIFRQAELRPDKEAVRDPFGAVTYAALADEICALATGLTRTGIPPGGRVLIALSNGIDFVRSHFAVMTARGISVPCEPNISSDRLAKIAADSGAVALIASPDTLRRLEPVLSTMLPLRLIAAGSGSDLPAPSLAEVGAMGTSRRPAAALSEDIASVLYTTGSTGAPKGVCLKHSNVLAAISQIQDFVGYTEEDREVVVLPISHSFGLGHVYCNLNAGGSVYLDTGLLRVDRVLRAIESLQATGFPGTPLGYSLLLDKYGSILPEKLRSLRFAVIDSAPLPPARTRQLQDLLPWLNIMVYYGLTEASRSTFISLTKAGQKYWTSVGKATANVRLRIESEQGLEEPVGQEGEVCIAGPPVSNGYWHDPEETAKRFRSGWLHTGDYGYIDEDGYLFLTGRLGDAINVGGLKVSPAEVEEVLRAYPGVEDAVVVGIASPRTGSEEVIGVIVPTDKANFAIGECERYCLGRLETYKAPARIVLLERIPRSITGKLLRPELREHVVRAMNAEITGDRNA